MTETPDDNSELPWADRKTVLREVDLRASGAVPQAKGKAGLSKNRGFGALPILRAESQKKGRVSAGQKPENPTPASDSKKTADDHWVAESGSKSGMGPLRRIKRLWSSWLMRLLDMKFPTFGAQLSDKKKADVSALLRPGDILLVENSSYPLSQIGARVIRSTWSHSGFYVGEGKVIDCGSRPYVAEVGLDEFLKVSDIAVYRPKYDTEADRISALAFAASCLDRPFNRLFNLSSERSFYCTQLISRALEQMPNPIILAADIIMRKPVILTSAIENSAELELIWISRNGLLKRTIVQLPSILAITFGGLLGTLIGPAYWLPGAALGLITILTAENLTNNDKWKRHSRNKKSSGGLNDGN